MSASMKSPTDIWVAETGHVSHPGHGGKDFRGFTPGEWVSSLSGSKADLSLKSFVFTLKNPHNFPAKKCMLKPEVPSNLL
jgi:hypothetical protein